MSPPADGTDRPSAGGRFPHDGHPSINVFIPCRCRTASATTNVRRATAAASSGRADTGLAAASSAVVAASSAATAAEGDCPTTTTSTERAISAVGKGTISARSASGLGPTTSTDAEGARCAACRIPADSAAAAGPVSPSTTAATRHEQSVRQAERRTSDVGRATAATRPRPSGGVSVPDVAAITAAVGATRPRSGHRALSTLSPADDPQRLTGSDGNYPAVASGPRSTPTLVRVVGPASRPAEVDGDGRNTSRDDPVATARRLPVDRRQRSALDDAGQERPRVGRDHRVREPQQSALDSAGEGVPERVDDELQGGVVLFVSRTGVHSAGTLSGVQSA